MMENEESVMMVEVTCLIFPVQKQLELLGGSMQQLLVTMLEARWFALGVRVTLLLGKNHFY